jgi:nucleotide-binding universal stress UspA family protein
MMRWLVPIDGSAHALRAVEEVVRLASQLRQPLEVFLLNVQPEVPVKFLLLGDGTPSDKRKLEEPLFQAGEETLQPARARLELAKIPHACHVEIGHAPQVIARFAKTYHFEMIVMATRGLDAGSAMFLGSVAIKVVHLVEIPVLLVR